MQEMHGNTAPTSPSGRWWLIPAILLLLITAGAGAYLAKGPSASTARGAESAKKSEASSSEIPVEVVKPTKGVLERTTSQAGTAMAFKWIDIYAEVAGYLKNRTVDIGSVVKKDQVLAEIEVPELKARVEQQTASLGLAHAQVKQRNAAILNARAELKGVEAKIKASEAKMKSDKAYLVFREAQAKRFQELLKERSIDARLVDEQEDRREAAFEAVNASFEAVNAAKAQRESAEAKITQAEADLEEAEQKVKVTKAELDHARAMLGFATIKAPFDGIITFRKDGFDPGTFIRAATGSSSFVPLLTLQHTEIMRIVVPIPDRDVPFCKPGISSAQISFDALPEAKFSPYLVSRIAKSEDLQTKTMRAEIDVPNPKGEIEQGMYGLVTVTLSKAENALSIPSACLAGKAQGGKATVYVVRDGKAHRVAIRIGLDNGIQVEVLKGLDTNADVIVNPPGDLVEDVAVAMREAEKPKASSAGH
ncbi:MAG TPA: efflux RND transporter periplasmic adaptor subunit [Gemmataceae bacterium]|nr:efflux RND transporter periplasmic adaptor subunit [Gemmataceae bacterium]